MAKVMRPSQAGPPMPVHDDGSSSPPARRYVGFGTSGRRRYIRYDVVHGFPSR